MTSFYNHTMTSITGEEVSLSDYEGKVCLVVNVASKWGLTPQYAGLRTLHHNHQDEGFTVLGFPSNQFGDQEPGTNAEILDFATSTYDVNFPMFSKIEVNGDGAAPVFDFLKQAKPNDDGTTDIVWNFNKFLVGRDGQVLARFAPMVTPEEIGEQLADLL